MVTFSPLTLKGMGQKAFAAMDGYAFAVAEAIVPIVAAEFPNVARAMPIAFIKEQSSYVPVAVMSLGDKRNLFVGPAGRWLGAYIPSAFRTYPFRLVPGRGESEWVVLVDESCPAIVPIGGDAQPLFGSDGKLSMPIMGVIDVLKKIEVTRLPTLAAVAALAHAKLLKPLDMKFKVGENERSLAGLYCIDELALNALADEAYLAVRKAGGMGLAYMQLLSMGHFTILEHLVRLQNQAGQLPARPANSLDSTFSMSIDDTLQF